MYNTVPLLPTKEGRVNFFPRLKKDVYIENDNLYLPYFPTVLWSAHISDLEKSERKISNNS